MTGLKYVITGCEQHINLSDMHHVNSALYLSGVAKSSTSFGWGEGENVTAAWWQVTLGDPIWHVISGSGVVISITNCCI